MRKNKERKLFWHAPESIQYASCRVLQLPITDDKWAQFTLNDPSCPSYSVLPKDYFGPEKQVQTYLQEAGYNDVPLKPCRLLGHQVVLLEEVRWEHFTYTHWPYICRAQRVIVQQALLELDWKFYVCTCPTFRNLQWYSREMYAWISVPDICHGNHGMIRKEGDDHIASMYTTQACCTTLEKSQERMDDPAKLWFDGAFEEILGDI